MGFRALGFSGLGFGFWQIGFRGQTWRLYHKLGLWDFRDIYDMDNSFEGVGKGPLLKLVAC